MKTLKNLLVIFFTLVLTISYSKNLTLKKTGFYGAYIKKMPSHWKFWKNNKVIDLISKRTEQSIQDIRQSFNLDFPIFFSRNYEKAKQLEYELKKHDCILEIKELNFNFKD